MADRIVRDELLESERWLALRDNTARVCYLTLILSADALGNLEAHIPRLVRLWRDYGVASALAVEGTLEELMNHDLIRMYEAPVDNSIHRYLHIPRSRQNLRYVKRVFPLSPWTTDKQIQILREKSPGERIVITGRTLGLHGRSEEMLKGSEEKRSDVDVDVEVKEPGGSQRPVVAESKRQKPFLKKIENLTPEERQSEIDELNACIAECKASGKTQLLADLQTKLENLTTTT